MPKLYVDTNILVDFLTNRQPFEGVANRLMNHIEGKHALAFASPITFVHAHYQLRKFATEPASRVLLEEVARLVRPIDVSATVIAEALANEEIRDFEDAVQWAICQYHSIEFLITRNQKDFPASGGVTVCDA